MPSRSGAARNRLSDVLGLDELRRALETGGGRQVGVDRPPACEPAELVVCARYRGVAVRVPADRDLTYDAHFAG
jgi:hypothetical protein